MRLTLKAKVILLALVPVILFALVLSGTAARVLQNLAADEVAETRERLLQEKRSELEHYIQIALGSVKGLYDGAAQGDMASREQAIAILSKIKYGADGYFFGHDSNVVRLFRGDSPVDVGKSLVDRRDSNGVYINRELVNVAKNNTYFVNYSSPLPGNEAVQVPKLAYSYYLPKWDMALGTALNLDGIEAQIAEVQGEIDRRIGTIITSIMVVAAILLLVFGVIGVWLGNAFLRPLQQIKANLDDIAAGEGDLTRRLPITSEDELGQLAGSFNRFVEKVHGLVRQIVEMTGQLTELVGQVSKRRSAPNRPWGSSVTKPTRWPRRSTKCPPPLTKSPRVRRMPPKPRSRPIAKGKRLRVWSMAASSEFTRWWRISAAAASRSIACSRT